MLALAVPVTSESESVLPAIEGCKVNERIEAEEPDTRLGMVVKEPCIEVADIG